MSDVIVDARGQLCPKPLILTRQALKDNIVGTEITVLIDNETSCQNVERFLTDNGMTPHISADGSEFILRFTKHVQELAVPDAESYCCSTPPADAAYVISLASETVGRGSAELGAILMQGLMATLKEVDPVAFPCRPLQQRGDACRRWLAVSCQRVARPRTARR